MGNVQYPMIDLSSQIDLISKDEDSIDYFALRRMRERERKGEERKEFGDCALVLFTYCTWYCEARS